MSDSTTTGTYNPEQISALRDCMNLFLHRVEFQTGNMFDRLVEELQAVSERVEPYQAREALELKALLQGDVGGWTERYHSSLRRRVDSLIDGRSADAGETVAPPSMGGLSLVDDSVLEVDVATRVFAQRMGEQSGEDYARFSNRLAALLRQAQLRNDDNPFSCLVIAGATRDALEGTVGVGRASLTALALRQLSRVQPLDLAGIYRDLDQFLQQRGIQGNSNLRKAERSTRSGDRRAGSKDMRSRAAELLRDPQLSEQLASALLARVAAMNPAFVSAAGASAFAPHAGRFPPGAGDGATPLPMPPAPESIGGFPPIIPPPSQPTAIDSATAAMNSPQIATLALLGAPVPGLGVGGGPPVLQAVAAPLLSGVGEFQRQAMQSIQQLDVVQTALASGGVAAPAVMYSTEPLRQVAASPSFVAGATALDFTTIELVAMVFDYVFNEQAMAEPMKGVLTHLQIPMLKAALIDRTFFASKSHPARVLLNRLAEVGRTWREEEGTTDPTYQLVKRVVTEVVEKFERDLSLFTELVKQVDQFEEKVRAEATPIETKQAQVVEAEDKQVTADAWARRVIRDRLARSPMPQFVIDFLGGPWLRYLTKIAVEEGQSSERLQKALVDIDLLIGSIKDSFGPDERRRVIASLPKLIADLRAGCDAVQLSEAERNAFFDNMFALHSRIFKGMQVELPTSTAGQTEKVQPAKIDVELESAPTDVFREIAMEMEKGMWIEMQDDTGKLKLAKLSWISPQRTTYLFTTRQGHKAASVSPTQLAEWFREDRARILESEPVVDRALNVLLSELVVSPQ